MLDELSKNILDYMAKHSDVEEMNPNAAICAIAKEINSEPRLVRAAVRFLNDNGFIDYRHGPRGDWRGFQLSHKGLHSREFAILEAKEKWKERIIGGVGAIIIEIIVILAGYGISLLISGIQSCGG